MPECKERLAPCGCLCCDTHCEIIRECNLVPYHKDLVNKAMHKRKITMFKKIIS